VTLKCRLGVTQGPRKRASSPFDRSHTSSYSTSVVTMAVSCTVSNIKRDMGRICHISLPFNLHDHLEPFWFFRKIFSTNCPSP